LRITVDSSAYSTKFHDILHSWDRYVIAYGGRGSSKTDTFYLKYLVELFEPYYFKLAYINKEFSNIRDQQFAGFKRVAKRIGVYDRLKFYDGDYRIVNPANDNTLIPKGMDDSEKTKGLDSITAIWWDEINKGELGDFKALNELLRSPEATYLQFAMSFNPVREDHWLRHTFFDELNPHELHPDYKGEALLSRSTYLDNEFINHQEYLKTLIKSAAGNINADIVNIRGDWGQADEVVNPFLYNYDDEKHVSETAIYNPNIPLILAMDFNVNPLCGSWAQQYGKRLTIIDEVTIQEGNIGALCDVIERKLKSLNCYKARLKITGDRNGNAKKIGMWDNKSSYIQMKEKLGLADSQFVLPGNPFISNSRVHCNEVFDSWDVAIHPNCRKIRTDLLTVACNSDGEIIKKNRKLDAERADHLDSVRYLINSFCQ
jgi:PBSX family phage terminase large subunit